MSDKSMVVPVSKRELHTDEADLKVLPVPPKIPVPGQQLTIGDLHGNAMKLIYFLVSEGVLQLKADDKTKNSPYEELRDIYNENPISKAGTERFAAIIAAAEINPATKNVIVRCIGDDIADRGKRDDLIFQVINKMQEKSEAVTFKTVVSNHGIARLDVYEQLMNCASLIEFKTNFEQLYETLFANYKPSRFFFGAIDHDGQVSSMHGMFVALQNDEIRFEQIKASYKKYKESLCLIDYSINAKGELLIYSHAPIDLSDINKLASHYKLTLLNEESTVAEIAGLIEQINAKFKTNLQSPELLKQDLAENSPVYNFVWMRRGLGHGELSHATYAKPPPNVMFVHGHDGEGASPDGMINLDDSQIGKPPVDGKDNDKGKLPIYVATGEYPSWEAYVTAHPEAKAADGVPVPPTTDTTVPTITDYMKTPHIPSEVEAIWKEGHAKFEKDGKGKNKVIVDGKTIYDPNKRRNGRGDDWIKDTFGTPEDEIIAKLQKIPPPQTWSCADIAKACPASTDTTTTTTHSLRENFTIVTGQDCSGLPNCPLANEGIMQLASQYNYQESPSEDQGPEAVTVGKYLNDPTQGPLTAIEAATAAMHRRAAALAGTLPHALSNVDLHGVQLQNGYLMPSHNLTANQKLLAELNNGGDGRVHVLPQWVRSEVTGETQMHVCTAAPSFQGCSSPEINSTQGQICLNLLVAQYQAIARLAVIRSRETGKAVPLHLTGVGQGVFNNPPEVMNAVMEAVAKVVAGTEVQVFVHDYAGTARHSKVFTDGTLPGGKDVRVMSADTFQKATLDEVVKHNKGAVHTPAPKPAVPVPKPAPPKPAEKSPLMQAFNRYINSLYDHVGREAMFELDAKWFSAPLVTQQGFKQAIEQKIKQIKENIADLSADKENIATNTPQILAQANALQEQSQKLARLTDVMDITAAIRAQSLTTEDKETLLEAVSKKQDVHKTYVAYQGHSRYRPVALSRLFEIVSNAITESNIVESIPDAFGATLEGIFATSSAVKVKDDAGTGVNVCLQFPERYMALACIHALATAGIIGSGELKHVARHLVADKKTGRGEVIPKTHEDNRFGVVLTGLSDAQSLNNEVTLDYQYRAALAVGEKFTTVPKSIDAKQYSALVFVLRDIANSGLQLEERGTDKLQSICVQLDVDSPEHAEFMQRIAHLRAMGIKDLLLLLPPEPTVDVDPSKAYFHLNPATLNGMELSVAGGYQHLEAEEVLSPQESLMAYVHTLTTPTRNSDSYVRQKKYFDANSEQQNQERTKITQDISTITSEIKDLNFAADDTHDAILKKSQQLESLQDKLRILNKELKTLDTIIQIKAMSHVELKEACAIAAAEYTKRNVTYTNEYIARDGDPKPLIELLATVARLDPDIKLEDVVKPKLDKGQVKLYSAKRESSAQASGRQAVGSVATKPGPVRDWPRLAMEFASPEERDEFLNQFIATAMTPDIGETAESETYKQRLEQFPSLFSQVPGNPNTLYIEPSTGKDTKHPLGTYVAANGELAVNFGNQTLRDQFESFLSLRTGTVQYHAAGQPNATYFIDTKNLPSTPDPEKKKHILSTLSPALRVEPKPKRSTMNAILDAEAPPTGAPAPPIQAHDLKTSADRKNSFDALQAILPIPTQKQLDKQNTLHKNKSLTKEAVLAGKTPRPATKVTVSNSDSLEAAKKLRGPGKKIAVLNMMNAETIGGGAVDGAKAQEEDLMLMTNYYKLLQGDQRFNSGIKHGIRDTFPTEVTKDLMDDGCIVTKDVSVLRTIGRDDKKEGVTCATLADSDQFAVTMVASAACYIGALWSLQHEGLLKVAEGKATPDKENDEAIKAMFKSGEISIDYEKYKEKMKAKITAKILAAIEAGCTDIILGAFGCGAFASIEERLGIEPPGFTAKMVSEIYKDVLLKDGLGQYFDNIDFSVLGVGNNGPANVEAFTKEMASLTDELAAQRAAVPEPLAASYQTTHAHFNDLKTAIREGNVTRKPLNNPGKDASKVVGALSALMHPQAAQENKPIPITNIKLQERSPQSFECIDAKTEEVVAEVKMDEKSSTMLTTFKPAARREHAAELTTAIIVTAQNNNPDAATGMVPNISKGPDSLTTEEQAQLTGMLTALGFEAQRFKLDVGTLPAGVKKLETDMLANLAFQQIKFTGFDPDQICAAFKAAGFADIELFKQCITAKPAEDGKPAYHILDAEKAVKILCTRAQVPKPVITPKDHAGGMMLSIMPVPDPKPDQNPPTTVTLGGPKK